MLSVLHFIYYMFRIMNSIDSEYGLYFILVAVFAAYLWFIFDLFSLVLRWVTLDSFSDMFRAEWGLFKA